MMERLRQLPWLLWWRQTLGVTKLELRKSFLQRKMWWLLALAPVALTGAHSLLAAMGTWECNSLGTDSRAYAQIFQVFILRIGIFFGCAGIFTTIFRGELVEKTLHYYLLTPMRREILVGGKFLAAEIVAQTFFTGGAALAYVLLTLHHGAAHWERLLRGPGLFELGSYVLVAGLACLGYGAVFLAMGMWFKNPMIPAAIIMVWENINPFLPGFLKKFSVIFFLKGLCPVDVPMEGTMSLVQVLADPVSPWVAISGILTLSVVVVGFAAFRMRNMEVSYGD